MPDRSHIVLTDREEPVLLAWPTPANSGGFLQFEKAAEWRNFVKSLRIDARIPDIVCASFARARVPYLLGWIYFSLVKAGELAALIALQLAVMDRYGGQISKRKRSLVLLLKHMVETDGLTDAQIPMVPLRRHGSRPVNRRDPSDPSRAEKHAGPRRSTPIRGSAPGGLLELVRDLINFAYRDPIAEAANR